MHIANSLGHRSGGLLKVQGFQLYTEIHGKV